MPARFADRHIVESHMPRDSGLSVAPSGAGTGNESKRAVLIVSPRREHHRPKRNEASRRRSAGGHGGVVAIRSQSGRRRAGYAVRIRTKEPRIPVILFIAHTEPTVTIALQAHAGLHLVPVSSVVKAQGSGKSAASIVNFEQDAIPSRSEAFRPRVVAIPAARVIIVVGDHGAINPNAMAVIRTDT